MNALRISFLLSALLAGLLLGLVREAPPVYDNMVRSALQTRAEQAALTIAAAEEAASTARELVGRAVAVHPAVLDALGVTRPVEGIEGAEILPLADRTRSFSRALQDVERPSSLWFILYDADGRAVTTGTNVDSDAVWRQARAEGARNRRGAVHATVRLGEELVHSVALPITDANQQGVGVLIVLESLDNAYAARMRGRVGASLAIYHQREVIADAISTPELSPNVASLVVRTPPAGRGVAGSVAQTEFLTVQESGGHSQLAMLASVPFSSSGAPTGAGVVLLLQAAAPASSLLGILVEGQAFEDGVVGLFAVVLAALMVFLLGLLLHDFTMQRQGNLVAAQILDRLTMNDPTPTDARGLLGFFRPTSDAFNQFLRMHRDQTAALRRAREDLAMAELRLEQAETALESRSQLDDNDLASLSTIADAKPARVGAASAAPSPVPSADPRHEHTMFAQGRAPAPTPQPPERSTEMARAADFLAAASAQLTSPPKSAAAVESRESSPSLPFVAPPATPSAGTPALAPAPRKLPTPAPPVAIAATQTASALSDADLATPSLGARPAPGGPAPLRKTSPAEVPVVNAAIAEIATDQNEITRPPWAPAPPAPITQAPSAIVPVHPTSPPPVFAKRPTPGPGTQMGMPAITGSAPRRNATISGSPLAVDAGASASPNGMAAPAPAAPAALAPVPVTSTPATDPASRQSAATLTGSALSDAARAAIVASSALDQSADSSSLPARTVRERPTPGAAGPSDVSSTVRGVRDLRSQALHEEAHDDALGNPAPLQTAGTVPRADVQELARRERERTQAPATDAMFLRAEQRLKTLSVPAVLDPNEISQFGAPPVSPQTASLYEEYAALRARNGEDPEDGGLYGFATKLERTKRKMLLEHGCTDVLFRIEQKNGRAAIKASLLR